MVEQADVVSEGAVQLVDGVEGYFGSTSLRCLLTLDADGERESGALARLVVGDPNARLRLVRLAHREAVTRAGARSLGVLSAEIAVTVTQEAGLKSAAPKGSSRAPHGEVAKTVLLIDIDVSATLLEIDQPGNR